MSSEKNYLNDSYKSFFEDSLSSKDPELYKAIKDELIRQQQHIELIANFFVNSLDPNVMMFASLCNLDNFVDFKLKH